VSWKLVYTSQAKKDAKKISRSGLKTQTKRLLEILKDNPYKNNVLLESSQVLFTL
jgi:mRNA-degrading endonuclease RelE of RelBE toxin-antitoxin system